MVRPKKYLGQHFLKDDNIAGKIVGSLSLSCHNILEVGPGMGVLTRYLLEKENINLYCIEVDRESIDYLHHHYPELGQRILHADFLKYDVGALFQAPFAVIGNFPYNISSQILFRVLEHRHQISEVVCMLQKEVAQRITSSPGTKKYGILSVLLQAYYRIEYLFSVGEKVFSPPPEVQSAVIRLKRNDIIALACDEDFFISVVKAAFNQRRKTLRNSLKGMNHSGKELSGELFGNRPEQLDVGAFVTIAKYLGGFASSKS